MFSISYTNAFNSRNRHVFYTFTYNISCIPRTLIMSFKAKQNYVRYPVAEGTTVFMSVPRKNEYGFTKKITSVVITH